MQVNIALYLLLAAVALNINEVTKMQLVQATIHYIKLN